MQYLVIFEESKDSEFFAYVPDLEGCMSFGETIEDCRINIHEAIEIYLEESKHDGLEILIPQTKYAEMMLV